MVKSKISIEKENEVISESNIGLGNAIVKKGKFKKLFTTAKLYTVVENLTANIILSEDAMSVK